MAPLKLEDNIREQFENRKITPSPKAWKQLSNALDQNTERPKRGLGIWWAIAAGIAGLALLGSLLFNNDPATVNNEIVIEELPLEEVIPQKSEAKDEIVIVQPTESNEVDSPQDKPMTEKANVTSQQVEVSDKEAVAMAVVDQTTTDNNLADTQKLNTADVAVKQEEKVVNENIKLDAVSIKVAEVVANIKELEATNSSVTEAEIAVLLDLAQKELNAKSKIDMATLKVDPNALLMDVEFDLERSFRDKVFDALGDGYNKIRTAMATRNN